MNPGDFIDGFHDQFFNYRDYVSALEVYVAENLNLQYKQNPIVQKLNTASPQYLLWVIKEYSQFSNESIHMLMDSRVRVHEWKKLAEEIDRNIEEEKGKETLGVPHLEIMRKGYRLSFDFDVNNYSASDHTRLLLKTVQKVFRTKNNALQAGAVLAFESLSIPEFYVLDSLVEKCENYLRTPTRNEYTAEYIKGHKHFEIGHKEGLLQAIEPYISETQAEDFADGYLRISVAISNWWQDLSRSL